MGLTARFTQPCNTMITPELRRQIDREADERGLAMAAVVRERLERSYNEHPVDSVVAAQ